MSADLSASTVTKLAERWRDEQAAFARRDLSGVYKGKLIERKEDQQSGTPPAETAA